MLSKILGKLSIGAKPDEAIHSLASGDLEDAKQDDIIQVAADLKLIVKSMASDMLTLHVLSKNGPHLASSWGSNFVFEEMNSIVVGGESSMQKAFPFLTEHLDEIDTMAMETIRKLKEKAAELNEMNLKSEANQEDYSFSGEEVSEASIQPLSPSSFSEELNSYDESEEDRVSQRLLCKDIDDDTVDSVSAEKEQVVRSSLASPLASPPSDSIACSDCEQKVEAEFDVVPDHQSDAASVLINDEVGNNAAPHDVNTYSDAIPVQTNDVVCFEVVQGLNVDAAILSNHIDRANTRNNSFLNRLQLSAMEESRYIYGPFDPYTPIIVFILHKLKHGGNLKSVVACMRYYATVFVTDMTIFREVKEDMMQRAANLRQIAAHMERDANGISFTDINGTAADLARFFAAEAVEGNTEEANNGDSVVEEFSEAYLAAIDAYNRYEGKEYERLPKGCAVVHQKVRNASSVQMCLLVAVRVSDRIKLSHVSDKTKQAFLELIYVIARVVKPCLTREKLLDMTLYQVWEEILYPTVDLSLDQLFEQTPTVSGETQPLLSIIIQTTTLFKDEMGDKTHIDEYKRSECVSTVEDMDSLRLDEIERRKEQMKDEDYYFCEKRNGSLQSYRRKPCGAILLSLINVVLLAKTLKPFGLQDSTIDILIIGILCNAPSNFCRKGASLAFLFDEENFRRRSRTGENDDVVKAFVASHIKPVLDAAKHAMKAFEERKHFAANSQLPNFATYLARTANVQNDS